MTGMSPDRVRFMVVLISGLITVPLISGDTGQALVRLARSAFADAQKWK